MPTRAIVFNFSDYKKNGYMSKIRIMQSLQNKARRDRIFFDSLVRLIWAECKAGNTKSKTSEEWQDVLIPCYSDGQGATWCGPFRNARPFFGTEWMNTPRNKLSKREVEAIHRFIETHTFTTEMQAVKTITEVLFGSCIASSLLWSANRHRLKVKE